MQAYGPKNWAPLLADVTVGYPSGKVDLQKVAIIVEHETDPNTIREQVASAAPILFKELQSLAREWTKDTIDRLDRDDRPQFPKTFSDPVWGAITLYPEEVVLVDSPLLQRLRGTRQLGLAHYVYPGAVHNRLEHSRGVVEAAQRMMNALALNAAHHKTFRKSAAPIPEPSDLDIQATRIAALLHDVGHGPFSHATENVLLESHASELQAVSAVLRSHFHGTSGIATGEVLAALIVLTPAMKAIFDHPRFGAKGHGQLVPAVVARMLGSRSYLTATYFSGVISGPIDADKLDYMARDCHHSGLPLGLDINRLISKLEVVMVTPQNAPNSELRERAEASPHKQFFEIGIAIAGLGAYEQMIIARAILYDRLYYHHKVRAAEAMLHRLLRLRRDSDPNCNTVVDLFWDFSDDVFLNRVSRPAGRPILRLGVELERRALFRRAYAFAARFIDGLDGLPLDDQKDTKGLAWSQLLTELASDAQRDELAKEIARLATRIGELDPSLGIGPVRPEDVIIDLPANKAVARGSDILTNHETGYVGTPNLFFDPEKWSQAYETQKQSGYVFARRSQARLVNIAAKLAFCDRFKLVLNQAADHLAKIPTDISASLITKLEESGEISSEAVRAFKYNERRLAKFAVELISLPDEWKREAPDLAGTLCNELNTALSASGIIASHVKLVAQTIGHLATFVKVTEAGGTFTRRSSLPEVDLQKELLTVLRSLGVNVQEGVEVSGGESDLIVGSMLVIENKVRDRTSDPFTVGTNYSWQARRYAIAVVSRVFVTVVAYVPTDERGYLPQTRRIRVIEHPKERFAEIRVVVPWNAPAPHEAKAPP